MSEQTFCKHSRQNDIKSKAMKNIFTFALLFSLLTFNSFTAFSQNQKKAVRAHKGQHHHSHHQGGPRKFHKNKVIIVKKRRGRVVQVMPVGHMVYVHGGRNYYCHDGYFYNSTGNAFTLVPSPFGLRVKMLPPVHRKIIVLNNPYFYSNGSYYITSNNEFETVEPVIGAIVPDLPQDNIEEITIDGEKLFEYDGFLYKALADNQYELVGKLEV